MTLMEMVPPTLIHGPFSQNLFESHDQGNYGENWILLSQINGKGIVTNYWYLVCLLQVVYFVGRI